MKPPVIFSISDQSTVLGPQAHMLADIMHCLKTGASIPIWQNGGLTTDVPGGDIQFLYCETSGSSGSPKVIRRRPETWIRSFDINSDRFGITSGDTYAALGNLGHSLVLFAVLEALHIGADISVLSGLLPKTQIRQLIDLKVSTLYATPTQLRLLLAGARAAEIDTIPGIRLIFSGGGKMDAPLRKNLRALCPRATIQEFFGASETSFITMSDDTTPQGSVGLAYPDVRIRIVSGKPATAFETGEIWVSSPYLFDGYEGPQPDDTQWEGAFINIGELGYLDEAGYLFLRGRKNRMVTVSDKNVFPEEIEKSIMKCAKVDLCVVLGLPDKKRGNQIICVIQGEGSYALEQELKQRCRMTIGAHAVPRQFVFLTEIPLLVAGKPDLRALQHLLEHRV